ncbi:MAG: response regulator [Candidatus Omnitrophica bacterium]|nr:response regulator [Candidatus Omnitrophota bacterium]MDD5027247.1 response regulator [Candidatus Omnitrophota bacterium]MDD5661889.1 response regulator [Candidatus Omnitrophota bacterium]
MAKKILIVDDNENNRLLMSDILEYRGYEILQAEDGAKGISMAAELQPDLILLDMQMPGIDGFAAAKMLKNDPLTRDIKVIVVTSLAMKGDREKIMALGVDDYIAKPIDTRQFPVLVEKYIGKA